MKSRSGFTIVEVTVVIVVIAILASVTLVAYNKVQQNSRDNTRQGNVTTIDEALEKYYNKNGEYPSVRSLVNNYPDNTGTTVAAKLDIKTTDLLMPRMPSGATNSLTSAAAPSNDYIVYTAQSTTNDTNCQSLATGGCDKFSLQYQKESGDLITINSRHSNHTTGSSGGPSIPIALSSPTSSL